jgi:hypothetical protein
MWEHEALTAAQPLLREQVAGDIERERDFQVLHLRLVEGLKAAHVAAMMKLSRQDVYTKYHEMRERFKSIVLVITGGPGEMVACEIGSLSLGNSCGAGFPAPGRFPCLHWQAGSLPHG